MTIHRVVTASGSTLLTGMGYAPEVRVERADAGLAGTELKEGPLRAEVDAHADAQPGVETTALTGIQLDAQVGEPPVSPKECGGKEMTPLMPPDLTQISFGARGAAHPLARWRRRNSALSNPRRTRHTTTLLNESHTMHACFPMNCLTRWLSPIRWLAGIGVASGLVAAAAFVPAIAQTSNVKGAEVRPVGGIASASASASGSSSGSVWVSGRNIYMAGGQVRTASAVEGDLLAAGGRVIVDQAVKGDAALAGGSVDVRAAVGDDLRVAAGSATIESSVGGELFASAGSITLTSTARVGNAASLFAGSVTIDGNIVGPLKVYAQKIVLNGEVSGDAHLAGEQVELGPTAKIGGALSYASAAGLKQASGASIGGATTREERGADRDGDHRGDRRGDRDSDWHMQMGGTGPGWLGWVFGFVALLAFAAVFVLVFPVFAARAPDTLKKSPWLALAVGFAALVAVPLLAVLLFITLLGIPLGIAVMALYPALLMTGYVVGVLFIARLAQTALGKGAPGSFAVTIGYFALALLLVMLVAMIPLVGALVSAVVMLLGLGGVALEVVRRRRAGSSPSNATGVDGA